MLLLHCIRPLFISTSFNELLSEFTVRTHLIRLQATGYTIFINSTASMTIAGVTCIATGCFNSNVATTRTQAVNPMAYIT